MTKPDKIVLTSGMPDPEAKYKTFRAACGGLFVRPFWGSRVVVEDKSAVSSECPFTGIADFLSVLDLGRGANVPSGVVSNRVEAVR